MSEHGSECAEVLRRLAAELGVEVNVSERRPGMKMPDGFAGNELNMRCPHGVSMWAEPTVEQQIAWAAAE